MYKWPQGRVIRIIGLILTLLIVADIGWNGGYGQYGAWREGGSGSVSIRPLALAIGFGVTALAVLLAGLIAIGFHRKAVDFLIEVEAEMVKVEWPSSSMVWRSTIVIAIAIVILSALIFGMDALIITMLDAIFKLGRYF